jgi:hypothetical protein
MSIENPIVAKKDFTRDLLYKKDFRLWLNKHKGLMRKVVEDIRSLMSKHPFPNFENIVNNSNYHPTTLVFDTVEDKEADTRIEFIRLTMQSASFRVYVGPESFFVKVQNPSNDRLVWEGGTHEFKTAEELRAKLKKLKFVDVVDYKMAYNYIDPRNQQKGKLKFLVSGWLNLPTLAGYLYGALSSKEREDILNKYDEVENVLEGYFDIGKGNCFYDKETKKIVLFDLHKNPSF